MTLKFKLNASTVLPAVAGAAGLAVTFAMAGASLGQTSGAAAENPAAVPAPSIVQRLAMGKKQCDPCAAKNPCAAAGCGACKPCNPCNPCAGGATTSCAVPRIAAAWACNPCNPCNPCAAKNPCAAAGCGACNPCNPCAAKNPCAAAGCGACNPCNPCAGGGGVEVTAAEAADAYDCIRGALTAAFDGSTEPGAADYLGWVVYAKTPYPSATHGGRLVSNYANETGANYGKYEDAGVLPEDTILAKDSFTVQADGSVALGPLFLMQKMEAGFNPEDGDWKYTMVMPDGSTFGITKGKNSAGMEFCGDCHVAANYQDHLFFMPEENRK